MEYAITEKSKNKQTTRITSKRSFNELELLAEDLECVKLWLDGKNVPTHDKEGNQYSTVGRIERLMLSANE